MKKIMIKNINLIEIEGIKITKYKFQVFNIEYITYLLLTFNKK